MVLIHDIVEIDSGDIPIFDTTKNHSNYKEELKAANRIFGILPKDQAQEMISIWTEFEDAKTPEAKFAKAMDRFEPLLQNASNEGGTWTDYKVKSAKVFKVQKEIDKGSNTLWDYSENLINECIEKGILQK